MASSAGSSEAPVSLVPTGRDPFWAFGEKLVANDTNRIKCNYCKQTVNGGITRFKHHLAGWKGNVKPCPQVPADVKAKADSALNSNLQSKRAKSAKLEAILNEVVVGGVHVDQEEDTSIFRSTGSKGPMDQFVHSAAESTKGKDSQQSTIESKYKKKARDDAAVYIGRWAYENGIPFNAICNSSFQQMAHAIGLCGPGMKIPTFYELREKILRGEVERTKEMLGIFTQTCKLNGCSIMTDAWTDRKGRSVMNIMIHCSSGVAFWLSKNVSSSTHDGKFIFDFLDEAIDSPESPGEHSILQIVTDSASNNMAAAKLMTLKRPTIFWTCCAAHTINLLLQDIGKLKAIKSAISLGRQLSIFIYGHTISLDMFRESTKDLDSHELIRPGVTRFATAFLSLESILEKKNQLRGLFTSAKWAATKLASSAGGKQAAMIVMSARFWANVELAVGIFTPFVRVLRRVDGDTPSMGWLYGDIKKAREEVAVVLDHQENKYLPIWKLIDSRWEKKMSSPLHLAGYYLNPYFYYSHRVEIEADGRFMSGFVECLSRIYRKDPSTQDHISAELDVYQYQQGLFGKEMAKRQLQNPNLNPVHWWRLNGADTPYLKTMAMKILSLTTSSSGCERNWSTFEMIHSKKRNKLDSKRLNDLVFVKFNALLKSKYSETSRDPLAAKNVDSGMVQEWMVNVDAEEDEDEDDDDEVFPGEGLTWAQIGNIVDADHDERRPQRLATSKEVAISYQRRGKRKISEVDEGDLEGSSDEDHILSTLPTIDEFSGDEE